MEYLHVCHFSNGHIKVGRSIEPTSRIAAHADRVSCVGIELVEHQIFECVASSIPAEAMLIEWCRDNCEANNKNEWFVGTDYLSACEQAQVCSMLVVVDVAPAEKRIRADFTGLSIYMADGRVNWQVVISQLRGVGLTQQQLASKCGTSQGTIGDLSAGRSTEPRFGLGTALLALLSEQRETELRQAA